jgi:hypothetical protein
MANVSKPQKRKGEKQMEESVNTKKRLIIAPKSMSLKLSRCIQEGIDKYIAEEEVTATNLSQHVAKEQEKLMSGSHNVDEYTLLSYRREDLVKIYRSIAYAKEIKAALMELCDKKYHLDF